MPNFSAIRTNSANDPLLQRDVRAVDQLAAANTFSNHVITQPILTLLDRLLPDRESTCRWVSHGGEPMHVCGAWAVSAPHWNIVIQKARLLCVA